MVRSPLSSLPAAAILALGLAAGFGLTACAGPNLWTDGSSVSSGRTNGGRVRQPARLRTRGIGYRIPERWRRRGFRYGTDELVGAITHAAARVRARYKRAEAGIADLSPQHGGPSIWHKSHQSGRDFDLLLYSDTAAGRPLPPPAEDMIAYGGDGLPVSMDEKGGYQDERWEERQFDKHANWLFVETLLRDPTVRVQWIFIHRALKARLLNHARRNKRPQWLISYAQTVMSQPGDALPHDDHMHIRIYCARTDRLFGCEDRGPVWQHEKKTYKYGGPERYDPVLWRQLAAMTGPTGG